ncbi:hypothetical protein ABBQ32_000360 [Trebouxia sp. C0010 RCD-2024]
MPPKVKRIMTQPINLIFRFLQSRQKVQIWLFEQKELRIEGRIIVSGVYAYLYTIRCCDETGDVAGL